MDDLQAGNLTTAQWGRGNIFEKVCLCVCVCRSQYPSVIHSKATWMIILLRAYGCGIVAGTMAVASDPSENTVPPGGHIPWHGTLTIPGYGPGHVREIRYVVRDTHGIGT